MDTPMILSAVGIGAALVLLAFLSIYQQARARLLLGRHAVGSSDPAYWTDAYLECVHSPKEIFDAPTFMAAVPALLASKEYA